MRKASYALTFLAVFPLLVFVRLLPRLLVYFSSQTSQNILSARLPDWFANPKHLDHLAP